MEWPGQSLSLVNFNIKWNETYVIWEANLTVLSQSKLSTLVGFRLPLEFRPVEQVCGVPWGRFIFVVIGNINVGQKRWFPLL